MYDDVVHLDGSSPLARGTPRDRARRTGRGRFIPARAGNTCGSRNTASRPAVHPRSRGEHPALSRDRSMRVGSSPLARGTLLWSLASPPPVRFIPARAGNTSAAGWTRTASAVHPRSRGEHGTPTSSRRTGSGSSPLARGTRRHPRRAPDRDRFIPARAGNTGRAWICTGRSAVHPRSRGEHFFPLPVTLTLAGSSPLARGTRRLDARSRLRHRFIPARAGNTVPDGPARGGIPVHPRSRGEHAVAVAVVHSVTGSSPLARGTRTAPVHTVPSVRFIPARAGNTRA